MTAGGDAEFWLDWVGRTGELHESAREAEEIESIEKAPGQSQELNNNTGGELFNRNSSFLEAKASGTAPQPVEKVSQPDFPANVQLHFTTKNECVNEKASFTRTRGGDLPCLFLFI